MAESDSFSVGGEQDAQQWSPSSVDDCELDQHYAEPHTVPSTNIDTSLPLPHRNTRGHTSPGSTTPLTTGFIPPSQPGYCSSPSLMAVTPPNPANTLGPARDTFPEFSPSTPVSPYGFQHTWPISKPQSSPEPEQLLPPSHFQRGPMIPQKRYKPHTSSDRRRYVGEVNLEPSIHSYMQKPDEEGIPLKDAMHDRFARPVSHDEPMFQERGPSISVRIDWPGYQPQSGQIPTRDFRNPPGPITRTRAKLAKDVAKSVARFISEQERRPKEEDGPPGERA